MSWDFPDEDASAMTTATLKGAVALMESQPETAADLRKRVIVPGGTTEAAIRALDDHRVKQAIIAAVITPPADPGTSLTIFSWFYLIYS
ncbi:MAG: pyrroline-5-carboxylate reductase dimerization domain-containing protein [Desulfobacterales bacterium]